MVEEFSGQWQHIIHHQMKVAMETWSLPKFCSRFNDAAFDGNLLMIKVAYSTNKANLLSKLSPTQQEINTLSHAWSPDCRLHMRLHRSLETEALCIAAAKDYYHTARFLIDRGVNVDGKHPFQRPRYHAELHRSTAYEDLMAQHSHQLVQAEIRRISMGAWVTPLYASAQWGKGEDTMRLLLDKGASVNSTWSFRGRTALFAAIRSMPQAGEDSSRHVARILARVRLLLEHGANPMIKAAGRESILHCAADRGHVAIMSYLLDVEPRLYDIYEGLTLLHRTSRAGHSLATRMLIERYPRSVNYCSPELATKDMDGYDALCWAVTGKDSDPYWSNEIREATVRTLLEHGADPNGRDQRTPPLILAVNKNEIEIVKLLLKAGADAGRSFAYGWTYLESSITGVFASSLDVSIVRALLAHGADPNRLNSNGRTPLAEVVSQPYSQTSTKLKLLLLETLLAYGADVNQPNKDGELLSKTIFGLDDPSDAKLCFLQTLSGRPSM